MSILENCLIGTVILGTVGLGCSYHLGWTRGRECGYAIAVGDPASIERSQSQPVVHTIFGLPYGLGWHHGWDYGFRAGERQRISG